MLRLRIVISLFVDHTKHYLENYLRELANFQYHNFLYLCFIIYLFFSCIRSVDLYNLDKINNNSSNDSILGLLTHLSQLNSLICF